MKATACAIGVMSAFVVQPAWAQAFPNEPVRLIAGAATGISGTSARLLTEPLRETWKQQVIVENRSGPGNVAAADAVAKAAPDGHTLLLCSIATHGISPVVYKKLPYDHIKDFAPISRIGSTPSVLVVQPSLPAKTVPEFIAYAKANPGKLQYGATGVGQSGHLAMELFRSMTSINVVFVATPSVSQEIAEGRMAAAFANLTDVPTLIKEGKVRAVAVTSRSRHPQLPDVPTVAESGMPAFEVSLWTGLCAPAAVPPSTLQRIHSDLVRILATPQTIKRFAAEGIEVSSTTPDQFLGFIRAENARWAKAAKQAGLQPE